MKSHHNRLRKTVGEKKNLFFTWLFEQGTPHFYFAQGPVNYIVGPDPRPFYPAINNLSVTLDICSKLKPLLVDSPLIYWALCLPACRFLLPALPPFSQRPPALCCSLGTESQSTVAVPVKFVMDVRRRNTNLCLGIWEKEDKDVLINGMGKRWHVLE